MDALLEALGKLLGTFKDPVQVLLLFVVAGLSFFSWKLVRFIMDTYERGISADLKTATALENLTTFLREKLK